MTPVRSLSVNEFTVIRKKFKCPYCSFSAMHQCILKRHMRSHTGERPYPCEICGKKFTRREHMKRHTLVSAGRGHGSAWGQSWVIAGSVWGPYHRDGTGLSRGQHRAHWCGGSWHGVSMGLTQRSAWGPHGVGQGTLCTGLRCPGTWDGGMRCPECPGSPEVESTLWWEDPVSRGSRPDPCVPLHRLHPPGLGAEGRWATSPPAPALGFPSGIPSAPVWSWQVLPPLLGPPSQTPGATMRSLL